MTPQHDIFLSCQEIGNTPVENRIFELSPVEKSWWDQTVLLAVLLDFVLFQGNSQKIWAAPGTEFFRILSKKKNNNDRSRLFVNQGNDAKMKTNYLGSYPLSRKWVPMKLKIEKFVEFRGFL